MDDYKELDYQLTKETITELLVDEIDAQCKEDHSVSHYYHNQNMYWPYSFMVDFHYAISYLEYDQTNKPTKFYTP